LYQLGNENFKPEFSLQEDIGLEFTSEHLSVNVSMFNNDISNYIFNKKLTGNSGQDSFIQGNPVYQFTQTAARLYGGEVDIDIHPHPLDWLHFENGISVVYAENKGGNGIKVTDSEKYLPLIPPLHFTSELRASFKQVSKTLRNSFFKVQMLCYVRQDRVYLADNTEYSTPGYTLFNAGVGSDICRKNGRVIFNLSLFGNNLFDVAYQDHLSRPKYFEPYPNDPRGRSGIYNVPFGS
jgi:iron complex outermembrane receptor protein